MLSTLPIFALAAMVTALIAPTGDAKKPYTICGADRGYTERDSLLAATYLQETIIKTDKHSMTTNQCDYAFVNTTVVSVCNGSARNRTVTRSEVKRGIDQLIKDCGLEGGFTGVHVVNDLSFAAYGVAGFGFVPMPAGSPPAALLRGRKQITGQPVTRNLSKRDCQWDYDGVSHFDCDWKNKMKPDGSCDAELSPSNGCQVFCEQRRTGWRGHEDRPDGHEGDRFSPGMVAQLTSSEDITITHGFSIGAEGGFEPVKEAAIAAGVNYEWSISQTKGHAVSWTFPNVSSKYYTRFVFFPKLIESCGTITQNTYTEPRICNNDACVPDAGHCSGEVKNLPNVCSLVPKLDPKGEPEVDWAVRFENADGTAVPFEEQTDSYRSLCKTDNPDGDPDKECYNPFPSKI